MPTDVVMPQMGESITEGTLTKWLKQPGETVSIDEPLFEISTDKVDAEIPSPAAGVLGEIKIQAGATVEINTVVCTIVEAGSAQAAPAAARPDLKADSATPPAEATAAEEAAIPAPAPEAPAPAAPAAPAPAAPAPAAAAGTEVLMPQMGESITEGTITKWLKNVGDTVQRDEPIFEISTDKVDAEIPSPIAGTLSEIRVQEGSTVTINTVVAVIGGAAATPAAAPAGAAAPAPAGSAQAPATAQPAASADGKAAAGETPRSSPLVRKMAGDHNVDLHQVAGTGSAGRITKEDLLGHIQGGGAKPAAGQARTASPQPTTPGIAAAAAAPQQSPAQAAVAAASQPGASTAVEASLSAVQSAPATTSPAKTAGGVQQLGEVVPMTRMRSIIAQRMVESKRTSPHVHTVFKVDMTRIVRLREKEKTKYEQRNGVKLTYMPFITRAAVVALRKHPVVNAAVQGDSILYNKNIAIGIAVALDWGLIVPVIKGCEEKNFLGVARSIVDLAERARTKKLAPDEASGGTFTLTNSGIFGEQFGTPIINQPQAAILGIGGLSKEVEVVTDAEGVEAIAIRSIQRFTLGFDHRIVDGADAGKFMTDFKNYLQDWNEDIG